MFQNATDLAAMAEALSWSTDYRVLRRLLPRPTLMPASGQETKIGILLDTETTGLDHSTHEIIELGMVKFDYTPDGRIVGVRDTFSAFNEPSAPIPPEVTALTGITDEMVAGHRIDGAAVTAFVDGAVIAIARNAGFDRKSPRDTGPSSRVCPGGAPRRRSIGASTASRVPNSATC
jgi:DNA polymerase III subunit epsilon